MTNYSENRSKIRKLIDCVVFFQVFCIKQSISNLKVTKYCRTFGKHSKIYPYLSKFCYSKKRSKQKKGRKVFVFSSLRKLSKVFFYRTS